MDDTPGSVNASSAPQDVPQDFVRVEGGSFLMGSPGGEAWREEDETQHTVSVSDF